MNEKQKLTPKYWVGHRKNSDDIIPTTMKKCRGDTWKAMQEILGEDWEFTNKYSIELIEIKLVSLKTDSCAEEGDWQ